MIYNSRLAQELGLWGESKNKGEEIHAAVFRAYFVDGRNIAQIPQLVELASSVGLPGDEAARILETRAFKEAVDADWDLSREEGITAVPTFMMNQDRLVGAQSYEALQMLVEANGVRRRSGEMR
jgi:predicted DsbA family dithiol-disulfide isomerase